MAKNTRLVPSQACQTCGAETHPPLAAPKKKVRPKVENRQRKNEEVLSEQTQDRPSMCSTQKSTIETEKEANVNNIKTENVHFTVNSKGGVGKSFTTTIIAGYYNDFGSPAKCIDTDPTTKTFSAFKAFGATRISNLIVDNDIDKAAFDDLIQQILTEEDTNHVIDTGASGYVTFMSYFVEGQIAEILYQSGKQVYFHIPVVGGQAQKETIDSVENLVAHLPSHVRVVVWLNEYFGKVIQDGQPFEKMPIYTNNSDRFYGVITVPKQPQGTFAEDIAEMLRNHMSFAEAIASPTFKLMRQKRLAIVRRNMYLALDPFLGGNTEALFPINNATPRAAE